MKRHIALTAAFFVPLSVFLFGCSDVASFEDSPSPQVSSSRSLSQSATFTKASEICAYVYKGYNEGVRGPIIVTEGILRNGRKSQKVYLVTLSGTESVKNQSTGYLTDALSAFNLKNPYYRNVVKVVSERIPRGSNIIFAGHSLGGMVAQQLAADETIKSGYNVLNTVTFGSPLLSAGSREGTVKRLGDVSDVIPYASGSIINNTVWAVMGLNRENGGYGLDVFSAHTQSYVRDDVWGSYDAVGVKGGSSVLVLNTGTQVFYKSPTDVDSE